MRQPERRASSTSLTPSTPTNPFCVGKPPRRATRNSLSQRLSRLVRSSAPFAGRALRAVLPGVAIPVEGSKFLPEEANSPWTPRVPAGSGLEVAATSSYCADYRGYGSVAQIRGALVERCKVALRLRQ